jgi:C4-dicarboxylate-specific signal transduction histidine kinase
MTATHHAPSRPATVASTDTPLERALEQNEAATDAVQKSADELLVINAVLKQEIPGHAQSGELAQALQKTDALELKIHDTAQELALVNEALAQEITERGELEHELAATKAALAKADPNA